jgi:hypothetical protein
MDPTSLPGAVPLAAGVTMVPITGPPPVPPSVLFPELAGAAEAGTVAAEVGTAAAGAELGTAATVAGSSSVVPVVGWVLAGVIVLGITSYLVYRLYKTSVTAPAQPPQPKQAPGAPGGPVTLPGRPAAEPVSAPAAAPSPAVSLPGAPGVGPVSLPGAPNAGGTLLMSNEEKKVEGHRRAIREHIEKYQRYVDERDKNFALKTIQRVQKEIADLKRRKPNIRSKPEDSWRP